MSKHRFLAILLLALVAAPGCYTQLRHPPADLDSYHDPREDWERSYAPPGFGYWDAWTYPYYTSLYGPVPWTWAPYYYDPVRWWDPWWHGYPAPVPGPGTPIETGGRHGWGRGPGAPYVPGIGGTAQPKEPGSSGQPAGTEPTRSNPPSAPAQNDSQNDKPEKPKKDEPERRGWRR
jgi:hypothetical protein